MRGGGEHLYLFRAFSSWHSKFFFVCVCVCIRETSRDTLNKEQGEMEEERKCFGRSVGRKEAGGSG